MRIYIQVFYNPHGEFEYGQNIEHEIPLRQWHSHHVVLSYGSFFSYNGTVTSQRIDQNVQS